MLDITDHELSILWIGAFRHYLRQQTAPASEFSALLTKHWKTLPDEAKDTIAADLSAAFAQDAALRANPDQVVTFSPLGADCNRHCWHHIKGLCDGQH